LTDSDARLDRLWGQHHARWRDPANAVAAWDRAPVDPELLRSRASGNWWDVLERLKITLLVTREYEHLLLAASVPDGRPRLSHLAIPHPSGLAVDRRRRTVAVASTRNPNQIYELTAVSSTLPRTDLEPPPIPDRPLVPVRSTIHPGALYIHDLAYVGGVLHANSVGQNAVAVVDVDDGHRLAWWPRCVERDGRPVTSRNFLQLNSIAAGATLEDSFFTASTDHMSARRPGHLNFQVDRRGVLFSGATREPVARGLTRPHSARLGKSGVVWIDDSGYGRLVVHRSGSLETVTELPGWTRGLCLVSGVAFVGTSRVIPRFSHYAPGLKPERSRCAIHAVDLRSGRLLGSLTWPSGNQIFAIESVPRSWTWGLPYRQGAQARASGIFYTFGAPRRTQSR
jgi:uncharacterized protein (TIGR03032 family)